MRQTVRFHIAFFATLIVTSAIWLLGMNDELTRIFVGTIITLLFYVAGDIVAHVHKTEVSKYDVAADFIGVGTAFLVLLII